MRTAQAVRRPSFTRRWLRRVVLRVATGALGIGSFVAWQLYRQHQDDLRLRETIAELDAREPRWRLEDLEAERAVVPDSENSSFVIRAAAARIPPWPPGMAESLEAAEPADASVALSDEQLRTIIDAFESAESAVAPILMLEHYPRGRHPITHSADGISTLLRHVDDMSRVYYRVLRPLLLLHLHEADAPAAVRDCVCLANLGRSIGDEPFAISQMQRQRYVLTAARGVERLLGQLVVSDSDLARLQAMFAQEAARDDWPIILRGERALTHRGMIALANGTLKTSALRRGRIMTPPTATFVSQIIDWLDDRYPPQLSLAHQTVLRLSTRLLNQTAPLPWHERTAVIDAIGAEVANAPDLALQWIGMEWFDKDKIFARLQRFHAFIRCALVAVAAERHRLRHGAWARESAELVPTFLPELPLDPFDGTPIRYKRLPDGVVIYAVSTDGVDDGGRLSPPFARQPMTDIGVRLWDVNRRRQPPPVEDKQP